MRFLSRSVCLFTIVALVGCTTLEPIAVPPQVALDETVVVGDRVVVRTHDGERYKFTVTDVSNEWIEGGGRRVDMADVKSLWIRRESPEATVLAVLGGLALLVITLRFFDLLDDIAD